MTQGFRTFHAAQNTWSKDLYFPTPPSFLIEWQRQIDSSQTYFRNSTVALRATLLMRIASLLQADKQQIQLLYCNESGLSVLRFETEFKRLIDTITLFANFIQDLPWQKQDAIPNENKIITKKRCAIGPVLVLGSSNFPLAYSTMGGDTVAALAAGCCVVVKAHPMHVGTSIAVANCIKLALDQLDLPTALFSHVIDNSYDWAIAFAQQPQIKAIGFTGSIKGGRALMDLASQRPSPIPVFAEMGSLNPVVVCSDVQENQIEIIAQQLANSICTDAGQFCTKPGLLLVAQNHFALFRETLLHALSTRAAVPMLHPAIFEEFVVRKRQVFELPGVVAHQSSQMATALLGLWGIAQTELQYLDKKSALLEEVFGPFAVLCSYDQTTDLKTILAQLEGQLTISIFTNQPDRIDPILSNFIHQEVGRAVINGVPTGVSVVASMQHGGAYPASSDARFSAVGPDSIYRFTKEVSWQMHHK